MVRLAESRPVFYVEEPINAAADALPHLATRTDASGVRIVTPSLPMASDTQRTAWLRELIQGLLKASHIQRPVLWYYTPMMLPFTRDIDASCIVYDCMDELANFQFAPPELAELEHELFAAADVVFTGGASLYDAKKSRHENVRLFASSVEKEHFAKARMMRRALNAESRNSTPRFGFHGVIDERMDIALLGAIAAARPQWQFEIIGPVVKIDPASLPRHANISYPGPKQYADLPEYLAKWDVAIMPFALNDATRFISPTKTPEYFAAGLPVVSTPIVDVVRRYGELLGLRTAATPEQFVSACEQALLMSGVPGEWLPQVDTVLALDSWDSTVQQMSAIIDNIAVAANENVLPLGASRLAKKAQPYDYLIVGAGFAGSVLAERLATQANKRVLVIDRRDHIGGNAYDEYDDAGVLVHRYGPHIFHTNSDRIVDYLSAFTEWRPYEHRVLASVRDKLVPLPINRTTLNILYDLSLTTDDEVAAFLQSRAVAIDNVRTAEDLILATVGTDLYETFFQCYTRKQWGMDASTLDKSVTARVPARTNTDDRYFTDKHQCMPKNGYTHMFENLLSHENIEVLTGVDWKDVRNSGLAERTIFSGPVDEYFDHRFGALQYRSLQFKRVTVDEEWFQGVGVVNYPSAGTPFTRITEYKHLTGQTCARSSLSYEYPCSEGEPYYPIPTPENQARYQQYAELAANTPDVTFVGRLGTYRYYNMDQVVGQALATFERLTGKESPSQTRTVRAERAYA